MLGYAHKPILLVEDTPPLARIYEEYLQQENYQVVTVENGNDALDYLNKSLPLAIVLDLLLPDINGLEVLNHAQKLYPDLPVVVVTVNNSVDVAVEAMRRGAYDFIVKPFPAPRLTTTIRNALERKALSDEVIELRHITNHERFFNFVGQSPAMQAVYRVIDSIRDSKANVFIQGENGTGKELAAQAIHNTSPRRSKPFVPINCAAIPKDLMESTIFGHVKGAFTGAISEQIGAGKEAHGGTLFLDEICEMPMELQTKLLRFVQTGEIMPVGSPKTEFVDVRIIAATNRDPLEEVTNRRFREDLYYRLHVIPLEMPALRDREDDVLFLACHFLSKFSAEENKNFTSLSSEVMALFRRYDWPGNVRQLENVIRNVIVLHDGYMVTEAMLPKDLKRFIEESKTPSVAKDNVHELVLVDFKGPEIIKPLWQSEKDCILRALDVVNQDITAAATLLEVSPSTIYRKLQAWKSSEAEAPAKAVNA